MTRRGLFSGLIGGIFSRYLHSLPAAPSVTKPTAMGVIAAQYYRSKGLAALQKKFIFRDFDTYAKYYSAINPVSLGAVQGRTISWFRYQKLQKEDKT